MIKLLLHSWLFSSPSLAGLSQQQSGLSQMLQFLKKRYRVLNMKYKTLKLLRRRKIARRKFQTTEKGVQVLIIGMALMLLLLVGCENVRQSIGISTNPFSTKFEEKTKLNYKVIFGKVRNKNEEDD